MAFGAPVLLALSGPETAYHCAHQVVQLKVRNSPKFYALDDSDQPLEGHVYTQFLFGFAAGGLMRVLTLVDTTTGHDVIGPICLDALYQRNLPAI